MQRTSTSASSRKIPGLCGVLVGLTALAVYIVVTLLQPDNLHKKSSNLFHWPVDFRVYYEAAKALNSGENLYDGNFVGNLPFTYPPFAGVLFRPLTVTDPHPMAVVWQVCSALVLLAVIIGVLRERRYSWGPGLFAVAFLSWVASLNLGSVFGTFYWGQINIFLMGLIALDFLRGPRSLGRGIFSGLAAGIKLTPSFFLIPLLVERRWFAAVTMTVTTLATVTVGWIVVPDARSFWTEKVLETDRIGTVSNPGAQSLAIVLERLGVEHHQLWWAISSALIVAVFCLAVRGALRYGNRSMVFALGGVVACVISPFSWYHHWVFIAPLFVVFVDSIVTAFSHVSERLTRRGRGAGKVAWCIDQCVGLATVAVCGVMFLPFSAPVAWEPTSFRIQGRADEPIMAGLMIYTAISFVVLVAVIYGVRELVDRRRGATPTAA
ncbi:glycosyltransferase 87 family protein [Corynebacterium anserum]|uniref:DUF2029 domain-containing protein n=1 Tax=Corynebacterium anserum TaxID=2684406 RepID=A0A7G7YMD2_9CORY|nr:glycosyltransferase 87 family protein [Corynebacterium anserum]QNH95652.1 DUF2029 domain-containing protein [Corynebacterium anserum]